MKRNLYTIYICVVALLSVLPAVAQNTFKQAVNRQGDISNPFGSSGDGHWAAVSSSRDSVKKTGVPEGIYVWKIDSRFGEVIPAELDTVPHAFQNDAFTAGTRGHYNYTGNYGAPRDSRLLAERNFSHLGGQFIFERPYDFFLRSTDDWLFTNTKSPFTNLTYHECGNKVNGEDRITGKFATNVNKRLGLGFVLDYLYGRGYYDAQSTAHFNGALYGSYRGERYSLHSYYSANHLKNSENGGIESDTYITQPEAFPTSYGTADMPTQLTKTWNRLNVNTFFLTHHYDLGFYRVTDAQGNVVRRPDVAGAGTLGRLMALPDSLSLPVGTPAAPGDTTKAAEGKPAVAETATDTALTSTFVPVASFVHTLAVNHHNRRFLSNLRNSAAQPAYFSDFYHDGDSCSDFTKYLRIENTLAFELHEGFCRWMKTGGRLFASYEFQRFTLPALSDASLRPSPALERRCLIEQAETENEIAFGAQLYKRSGKYFHYNLLGELITCGSGWGRFNVEGSLDVNLPFLRDTLRLEADGLVANEEPSYYYRHFHSRNAWWDVELDNVFRIEAGAALRYRNAGLTFRFVTLQNYAYFQENLTPKASAADEYLHGVSVRQASKNVSLLQLTLEHRLKCGILHWDNELTLQTTTNADVLPLPAFNGYTNLYLLFRIAKVLRTEIGFDARYFTKYYAQTYSPIIGQYVVQDTDSRIKTGNYPIVNAYVNFHLKRTRFYVMASHLNYRSGKGFPFLVPHYPLNRMVLRLGVSWNFVN